MAQKGLVPGSRLDWAKRKAAFELAASEGLTASRQHRSSTRAANTTTSTVPVDRDPQGESVDESVAVHLFTRSRIAI